MLTLGLAAGVANASGAGQITTYASKGVLIGAFQIAAGSDGALWVTDHKVGEIGRITTTGTITTYGASKHLAQLGQIAAGPDGDMWFTTLNSIGKISMSGKITTYTGTGINRPTGIVTGSDGALWFTNFGTGDAGDSVGRITTNVTPGIKRFTPASGAAGASVTIVGQNLSGATGVAFDGTAATIVSDTATKIVATVPAGAATGPLTITTPVGTATSSKTFAIS